jgi:hypothetical protein
LATLNCLPLNIDGEAAVVGAVALYACFEERDCDATDLVSCFPAGDITLTVCSDPADDGYEKCDGTPKEYTDAASFASCADVLNPRDGPWGGGGTLAVTLLDVPQESDGCWEDAEDCARPYGGAW